MLQAGNHCNPPKLPTVALRGSNCWPWISKDPMNPLPSSTPSVPDVDRPAFSGLAKASTPRLPLVGALCCWRCPLKGGVPSFGSGSEPLEGPSTPATPTPPPPPPPLQGARAPCREGSRIRLQAPQRACSGFQTGPPRVGIQECTPRRPAHSLGCELPDNWCVSYKILEAGPPSRGYPPRLCAARRPCCRSEPVVRIWVP